VLTGFYAAGIAPRGKEIAPGVMLTRRDIEMCEEAVGWPCAGKVGSIAATVNSGAIVWFVTLP